MAQRRMFSLKIVDTDAFLDMPQSSQLLYFHLSMRADDDGFVSNPKKVMRMIGSQEDDYKVLVVKKFIIPFESGVCVIKHWLIQNLIRGDRYTPTQYIREISQLLVDGKTKKYSINKGENKGILDVIPNGNQMDTQDRLGKDRLGKDIVISEQSSQDIPKIIDLFKEVNPAYKKWFGNTTQRGAVERMIKEIGIEKLTQAIKLLPKTNTMRFAPVITTPLQLEDKMAQFISFLQKKKGELPALIKIR